MHLYIHTHTYICICIYTHTHIYICRAWRLTLGAILWSHQSWNFETVSHWDGKFGNYASLTGQWTARVFCLHLSGAGITGVCYHSYTFTLLLGITLTSSCFHDESFTDWTIYPTSDLKGIFHLLLFEIFYQDVWEGYYVPFLWSSISWFTVVNATSCLWSEPYMHLYRSRLHS